MRHGDPHLPGVGDGGADPVRPGTPEHRLDDQVDRGGRQANRGDAERRRPSLAPAT
jgi:hypothetical protein